jgi:hypothetical protein
MEEVKNFVQQCRNLYLQSVYQTLKFQNTRSPENCTLCENIFGTVNLDQTQCFTKFSVEFFIYSQ